VLLYGLRLIDGGQQFVKVNANTGRTAWVDSGRLACSFFQLTDAGRPHVDQSIPCYTGGIDAHGSRGWSVQWNRFEDIQCAGQGLAEHAIHFWDGARDTIAENNTIVNCARGIGFGLGDTGTGRAYADDPYPGAGFIGHYDGIIRNNVIYATVPYYDTGIGLEQARGARVYHNTVTHAPSAAPGFFSSIDYRSANTVADIRNNLAARITQRDGASGRVESNLENVPASYFVDPASVNLHLTSGAMLAIDRGVVLDGAGVDIDGEPHSYGPPDLGADEWHP
jgi:hypothetical protein